MKTPIFPPQEYTRRVTEARTEMDRRGLSAVLISSPENIYYLTGLDHQGFFAYHVLVLPIEGTPVLVTRAMEKAVVRDQVPHLRHIGFSDQPKEKLVVPERHANDAVLTTLDESGRAAGLRPWDMSFGVDIRDPDQATLDVSAPTRATLEALREAGATGRVGMEESVPYMPFAIATEIRKQARGIEWQDVSGLVDDCRIVQSPLELERTRQAAVVSNSMMLAAIAAAGPGVPTHDVVAAIYDTMFRRGGTYPGFVPLVRTTHTIEHEHGTWQDDRLSHRDLLFLEMAGCVRRYHAPMGRLVFIGKAQKKAATINAVCQDAMRTAAEAIGPGVKAGEVYRQWQERLNRAGLSGYMRHHCGYSVGIGYPPSWSGSGVPVGLRAGSEMELREGMVFHLMSWLLRTAKGDSFLSDTIVVTDRGSEFLTTVDRGVLLR
ncbi:MAG: Xaa-Pro peptidase family protein [Gammaproteobacteria bacterium]